MDFPQADVIKAVTVTEEAVSSVEANANAAWRQAAYEALVDHAKTHPRFSAFEVTAAMSKREDVATHTLKAMGPIIRKAKKNGIIQHSGEFTANLRGHLSPTPIWNSLVFDPYYASGIKEAA
jgi:hypothetical protein